MRSNVLRVIGSSAIRDRLFFTIAIGSLSASVLAVSNHFKMALLWWTNVVIALLTRHVLAESLDGLLDPDSRLSQKELLDWEPLSVPSVGKLLDPVASGLFKFELFGRENLPILTNRGDECPFLLVSDHALMGIEVPLLVSQVLKSTGMFFRTSLDHFQLVDPNWSKLLKRFGAFDGTRENWNMLMRRRHPLVVYPGAFDIKTGGDLKWKNRKGFARLAIKHGYSIIPFCTVTSNEMMHILHDLPIGWIRQDLPFGEAHSPVFDRGLQKVYVWFGRPISTDGYEDDEKDAEEVRDLTRKIIRDGLLDMQRRQSQDKDRNLTIPTPAPTASDELLNLVSFSERLKQLHAKPAKQKVR
eukprot:TRINITY_DN15121_c0_g1_i1.p1 TRINITY_DN15121_c0_g1~~TRINITY_DN15121_c0_g1_i1.p1  ORF type:complete len:401 (-),score=92.67 TRINITY_DN15121_c0_g1_i1:61-1128(-)